MFGRFHGRAGGIDQTISVGWYDIARRDNIRRQAACVKFSKIDQGVGYCSSAKNHILLFDRRNHPSVPTCVPKERRAEGKSRLAALRPPRLRRGLALTERARRKAAVGRVKRHGAALLSCARADRPC